MFRFPRSRTAMLVAGASVAVAAFSATAAPTAAADITVTGTGLSGSTVVVGCQSTITATASRDLSGRAAMSFTADGESLGHREIDSSGNAQVTWVPKHTGPQVVSAQIQLYQPVGFDLPIPPAEHTVTVGQGINLGSACLPLGN